MQIKLRLKKDGKVIGYEWLENGEWRCGEYRTFSRTGERRLVEFPGTLDRLCDRELWTGRKDKNGTEAYDGDRVLVDSSVEDDKAKIFWDGASISWSLRVEIDGEEYALSDYDEPAITVIEDTP